jgi:hypothetical protein
MNQSTVITEMIMDIERHFPDLVQEEDSTQRGWMETLETLHDEIFITSDDPQVRIILGDLVDYAGGVMVLHTTDTPTVTKMVKMMLGDLTYKMIY